MLGVRMESTNPDDRRLFGWPGARNLAYAYLVLGPLLLAWFVFVYAGCDYLTRLHSYRLPLYWNWELSIPFVPATVVVYNSLHLAYSIAPFILRTRPEMNAMTLAWVLVTGLAAIFFLAVPFEVGYTEQPDGALGRWRGLYQFANDANLTFNSLPSLHVTWSILCMDVYAKKARRLGKLLFAIWGVAMMLSTLLTHFHHLSDVAAGFLLATFGSRILYPWLRRWCSRTRESSETEV
jgi:membrane-associated phospholipid phosphatase